MANANSLCKSLLLWDLKLGHAYLHITFRPPMYMYYICCKRSNIFAFYTVSGILKANRKTRSVLRLMNSYESAEKQTE